MVVIGCDYHPSVQQIAMVDTETGDYSEHRLKHSNGEAERFYRELKVRTPQIRVGIEAMGHSRWCEQLLLELGCEVWTGDAAQIAAMRVRKQTTDRQDAQFLLKLMIEDRFPRVWMASLEDRDQRQLLGLWRRQRVASRRKKSVRTVRGIARDGLWCEINHRNSGRASRSRKRGVRTSNHGRC